MAPWGIKRVGGNPYRIPLKHIPKYEVFASRSSVHHSNCRMCVAVRPQACIAKQNFSVVLGWEKNFHTRGLGPRHVRNQLTCKLVSKGSPVPQTKTQPVWMVGGAMLNHA